MASFVLSQKFSLNSYDWKKWMYNASVFFVPVALVFIAELVKLVPSDWQWGALALYVLNLLTDLIKKWANQNQYRK